MSASLDYAQQAVAMRLEFRRRHFSEREHLLMSWVLDFSLVCGREDMTAPTLEALGALVKMSRGNVHAILHTMQNANVLAVDKTGPSPRYRLNPRITEWQVTPRMSREELRFALASLREANGFDTDFFTQRTGGTGPNFPVNLDAIFSAAVPESGTVAESVPNAVTQ
jgi:hypothetical protein